MTEEQGFPRHSDYGFCLGIDIVEFSKRTVKQQQTIIADLERIVEASPPYPQEQANGRARWIPAGDGGFVAFFTDDPRLPLRCALEVAQRVADYSVQQNKQSDRFEVRMGVAAGILVPHQVVLHQPQSDNVVGDGINLTARVLSCADAGHILATEGVAHWLQAKDPTLCSPEGPWNLTRLGEYEVKHGEILCLSALTSGTLGKQSRGESPEHAKRREDAPRLKVPLTHRINWPHHAASTLEPPFPAPAQLALLPSLSEVGSPREGFIVAEARLALSHAREHLLADVDIEHNPRVALDRRERSILEKDPETGVYPHALAFHAFAKGDRPRFVSPMRWSAGGAILVLRCPQEKEYIVVGWKDEEAHLHPLHLIAASGLSENPKEWLWPEILMVRECAEKLPVAVERGANDWKLALPVYEQIPGVPAELLTTARDAVRQETEGRARLLTEEGLLVPYVSPEESLTEVHASLFPLGEDEVHIRWQGTGERSTHALAVLDPQYAVVDLIGCVTLKLDVPLSRIRVLDGQVHGKHGKPIHGDVFVFEPEQFANLFIPGESALPQAHFRRGEPQACVPFPPNPRLNPPLLGAGIALLQKRFESLYHKLAARLRSLPNSERHYVDLHRPEPVQVRERAPLRLVILDVEGVLTFPGGSQTPWPLEGMAKVRAFVKEKEILCVLCTGRQEPYGEAVIQAMDFYFPFPGDEAARYEPAWGVRLASYPSIFENGAYFYDPIAKRPVPNPLLSTEQQHRLQEMRATVVEDLVRRTGCQVEPGKDYGVSLNPPLREGSATERLTTEEFRPVVDAALHEWMESLTLTHSASAVDITPRGISKASAVEFLLKNTGFSPDEVLGIGDTPADEEWLAVVGHSAAPANGKGKVRGAEYYSDYEVTEGVLDILRHFLG